METFEAVTSFLEEIANLIGSCRIYENLFSPGDLESTGRAMKYLLLLYVAILEFIAEANVYFNTPSGSKFRLIWKPTQQLDMHRKSSIFCSTSSFLF